ATASAECSDCNFENTDHAASANPPTPREKIKTTAGHVLHRAGVRKRHTFSAGRTIRGSSMSSKRFNSVRAGLLLLVTVLLAVASVGFSKRFEIFRQARSEE